MTDRASSREVVLRWVGPGWLMAVPARDLTEEDLREIWQREGIERAVIEGSGFYEVARVRSRSEGTGGTGPGKE